MNLYQPQEIGQDLLQRLFEEQREEPNHLVQHGLEKPGVQTKEFHLLLIHLAEKYLLHEQGRPHALVQLGLVREVHQ